MNTATIETKAWIKEYEALRGYIASNEAIKITSTSMRIPRELREEFYSRIDRVELSLAKELAGARLEEARELAEKLGTVRDRIVENSNLRAYRLPATVENLIKNPYAAAARPILSVVMDALQTGLEPEEIESRSAQLIFPFIKDVSRSAYELWCYLGIIDSWQPRTFYGIATADAVNFVITETDEAVVGSQFSHVERRLPETVVVTADGRTLALKTEVGMELYYYGRKHTKNSGYSSNGNTVDEVAHRALLAYEFQSPDKVDVLADAAKHFVRPASLICTFLMPYEMENNYQVSSFVERLRTVRSLRPVQVLTLDEAGQFPEGMTEDEKVPKLERTVVGYDSQKLHEIAAKI